MTRVLFFGGNGHSAARLDLAQRVLATSAAPAFELRSVPYPGFEGRARASVPMGPRAAPSPGATARGEAFDAFLAEIATSAAALRERGSVLYATGVGGLLVLALRARGALRDVPAIFQAPVLWGLERRWMPRVMRLGLAQVALRRAFASPLFQRRFARKNFLVAPAPEVLRAFFEGYAACAALPDFFEWLTPALLRTLEAHHANDPDLLRGVRFLWGARDAVVPPRELAWTEQALGVRLDVELLPEWGHYPMIDDPESWVREVSRVASAASL